MHEKKELSAIYYQVCFQNKSQHSKFMIKACTKQFEDELKRSSFSIYHGKIMFVCGNGK